MGNKAAHNTALHDCACNWYCILKPVFKWSRWKALILLWLTTFPISIAGSRRWGASSLRVKMDGRRDCTGVSIFQTLERSCTYCMSILEETLSRMITLSESVIFIYVGVSILAPHSNTITYGHTLWRTDNRVVIIISTNNHEARAKQP